MLNANLNGAADLRLYIHDADRAEMPELYVKPMLMGMFAR